jgi:hypothetical protein
MTKNKPRFVKRPGGKISLPVLVVLAVPVLLGAKRYETPPWRGSFALGGGIFYAAQGDVRTFYGDLSMSLHVQLDLRLRGPFAVVLGYRYLNAGGATVIVGDSFEEESYGLKLLVHSLRAGFRLDSSLGRMKIFGQVGGAFNLYEESWEGTDIAVDGRVGGVFLAAGAEIPFGRALAIQVRLEYASIPTAKGGLLEPDVDLGGADAVLGIVYRFGRRK